MKFKIEWLQESLWEDDINVVNEIIDNSRWCTIYDRVFKHEGHFYRASYRKGSTEMQDEQPYESDGDSKGELECKEVFPIQKIITVYE